MTVIQGDFSVIKDLQPKIGVVTARFNREITEKLEAGALEVLQGLGLKKEHLWVVRVPGAVEIPLAVKHLFDEGMDGVVALGAVIRGDTAHFDYVCQSVERGCTELMIRVGKPIGFGVLTTENEDQAMARAGGSMGNKGSEAAEVVVEMLDLKRKIQTPNPP
jgi:6,7-dimethyl-8-ribityllumazine synthase